jgi:hypothetical protein
LATTWNRVVDDLGVGALRPNFLGVAGVHIHGHGLHLLATMLAQQFEEWSNVLPPAAKPQPHTRLRYGSTTTVA